MEQLNRVELCGYVGTVRKTTMSDGRVVTRMTVATNFAFTAKDGTPIIETTWHNVTFWADCDIEKGDKVCVVGRLRNSGYMGSDGEERMITEIVASTVAK